MEGKAGRKDGRRGVREAGGRKDLTTAKRRGGGVYDCFDVTESRLRLLCLEFHAVDEEDARRLEQAENISGAGIARARTDR
eukprot:257153-Rhodomonas_salina.1